MLHGYALSMAGGVWRDLFVVVLVTLFTWGCLMMLFDLCHPAALHRR